MERLSLKNLELVKGCLTDINGNGLGGLDDDYNGDGQVDDQDQDYYDGYNGNDSDPDCDDSDAYHAGMDNGLEDAQDNFDYLHNPFDWSDNHVGPDIEQEYYRTDPEGPTY